MEDDLGRACRRDIWRRHLREASKGGDIYCTRQLESIRHLDKHQTTRQAPGYWTSTRQQEKHQTTRQASDNYETSIRQLYKQQTTIQASDKYTAIQA